MEGPCRDLGYRNTRDLPQGARHKQFVEQLWTRFYPLADPHFREDARNHFNQRFWEMYLAVTLLDHGFDLHRQGDEGPEFYALINGRRVWFEAIAPDGGSGDDRVPEPEDGKVSRVPIQKILLRFTNAFDEKRKKYATALKKRIVSGDDAYVLAINSRSIPHAAWGGSRLPYFVQAFLPFGEFTISIDPTTLERRESYYQYQPQVLKLSGSPVSTEIFLNAESSFCSAVLHSVVDCANHPERLGDDFSILHNTQSISPIDASMFK